MCAFRFSPPLKGTVRQDWQFPSFLVATSCPRVVTANSNSYLPCVVCRVVRGCCRNSDVRSVHFKRCPARDSLPYWPFASRRGKTPSRMAYDRPYWPFRFGVDPHRSHLRYQRRAYLLPRCAGSRFDLRCWVLSTLSRSYYTRGRILPSLLIMAVCRQNNYY